MIASRRKCLSTLLGAALLAMIPGVFSASAADNLTKVTASPDLRRVIIESSGKIGQYNVFELERPPRLVIDVQGVSPGTAAKTTPPERTGGLKIQVSESRSGSHVVLDFGGGPVPSHRIRQMDNYLIVFLGDWRAPSASTVASAPPPAAVQSKPKTQARSPAKPRPLRNTANSTRAKLSDLAIKSAQVMDGIIVLKVADRANPDRLYRISLGVNLDRLGFVSAGIFPLTVNPGSVQKTEGSSHGPSRTSGDSGTKGPRKILEPATSAPVADAPNPDLRKRGPGAAKRRSAAGPRRSPIPSGSSGPVSLQRDVNSSGWKLTNIPRQSVSETARALLLAYRRSPHLRFETCCFTKPKNSDTPSTTVTRQPR